MIPGQVLIRTRLTDHAEVTALGYPRRTRMRVVQVAVADDDAVFRSALVEVLEADDRFTVVGAVGSGGEVVDLVAAQGADMVLLDVRMPGGGPEAARVLRHVAGPDGAPPLVVAISGQEGLGTVADMLRAGAVGYLLKGRVGADLPDLLARVSAGEVVLAVESAVEALRLALGHD
jgi:DNA-binding NarL/FixJ family response regulator